LPSSKQIHKNFIIYQGAVNEGRCFETLIPAMKHINCCLLICGKGNFYKQVQQLIIQHKVEDKVILKGYVLPQELKQLTPQACFGITLFEQEGMNQYYSLCNRFFDYIMAGIPQICVAYPEYEAINKQYDVAYLISNTQEQTLVQACNTLLTQKELYYKLKENCLKARLQLNWEEEEKKLLSFYAQLSV
jgi:glycosyltransferase involved in cell wall biosynthesis